MLLGILLAGPVQPVREYHCPRAASAVRIDGRLGEAAWEQAPWTEPFVDIRGEDHEPAPCLETRVKMLWDSQFLYIGANLEEPHVKATLRERDAIIWKDNDFEVFLDPDADGRNYFEIEINALGTVMDLLMDKPYAEGGNFVLAWDCKGLRSAVRRTGRGWAVELAIPFDSLAVGFQQPAELNGWRINFSRVEWLLEGGPEENWVWSPTGRVDIHVPERWGILYFEK